MSLHTSHKTPLYFFQSALAIVALAAISIFSIASLGTSAVSIEALDYIKLTANAFDVRGKINGSNSYNFQTTYNNQGYSIDFEVDGNNTSIKNIANGDTVTNKNITMTLTEEQTLTGVNVHLNINNPDSNGSHTYRIALTADVQIGSNDYAAIYKDGHSSLVATQDDTKYANDYGAKLYVDFVPDVTTSWIGFYKDRATHKFTESAASVYTVADNLDTGAAWSWQGTIAENTDSTFTSSFNLTEAETSTIKFYGSDGQLVEEKEALVGGSVTLPSLNDISGYTNVWTDDSDGTAHAGGSTIIVNSTDINFHETHIPDNYTISYDLNGGHGDNPTEYNIESDITLAAPEKTGYSFAGWTGSNGNTPETTVRLNNTTGNKSYKANWSVNQYTISLDNGGGSGPAEISQDYGTALALPTPAREGYTFAGWFSDNELTVPYTSPTVEAGDITLHAAWTVNQYTLTFNLDGGSGVAETITADYGSVVPAPAAPEKTGYSFAGWYIGNVKIDPDHFTIPAFNAEISARWTINQYTISYSATGDPADAETITADYGAEISAPADPTREGHTFLGWYEAGSDEPYEFTTMPAEDVDLSAHWQVNRYIFTLDPENGDEPINIIANYGAEISAPAAPEKTGFTFAGWYLDGSDEPYEFTTMPATPLQLSARWTVNEYSISYSPTGDPADIKTITGDYGTEISAPADPEREGHTFLGWYANGSDEPYEFTTIPAEDISLSAKWSVNQYTVTIDLGAGQVQTITADYGSKVSITADPVREGYTFAGWYIDGVKVSKLEFTIPATDISIIAKWEEVVPEEEPVAPAEPEADSEPSIIVVSTPASNDNNNDDSQSRILYIPLLAYNGSGDSDDNSGSSSDNSSAISEAPAPTTVAPLGVVNTGDVDGNNGNWLGKFWNICKKILPFLNLLSFFFLLFLIFKRRKDDEEEREENQKSN